MDGVIVAKLAFLLMFGGTAAALGYLLLRPARPLGWVERIALGVGLVCLSGMVAAEALSVLQLVRLAGDGGAAWASLAR